MNKIIVILLPLLALCGKINAQPNFWKLILDDEDARWIDNDSEGNIYVVSFNNNTQGNFVVKSTDQGSTWDTVFVSQPQYIINNLQIDTNYIPNDRIILDSQASSDYISSDYGETWDTLNSPNYLWHYRFTTFGDILGWKYNDYNIYRSTDDGITWDTSTVLPPQGANDRINGLEIDIFDNIYLDVLYESPNFPYRKYDDIYKSTDNGSSWILIYHSGWDISYTRIYTTAAGDFFLYDSNSLLSKHYLSNGNIHTYNLRLVSPWQKSSDHIYLISGYSNLPDVFFSPDTGNNWHKITTGLPTGSLTHSNLCNDALGYLYINKYNDGIYKTTFTAEKVFIKSVIDFGDVKLYDTNYIQVTIQNPFDFDIEIDSVISYNNQFFVSDIQSNLIPVGDSISAKIAFSPTEYDTTESYLFLYSELINAKIKVEGNSPYPLIGTAPTSILLFGKVPVDSTIIKTFKIFNKSSLNDLIVDDVVLKHGNVFDIENLSLPIVLETNDTSEFSISFQPSAQILYWDSLTIHSNTKNGIKIVKISGEGTILSSVKDIDQNIFEFSLNQNYPNPFNPTTKIKYQIPELSFVTIKVYDVLGNEITTLVNEEKSIGSYDVEFNASTLPSGIYFYQIQAGSFVKTKKMVLMK